jgi:hypothetical protein
MKEVRMKTSCFHVFQGPGRICIARYAPRGTPAGFRTFKALAPGEWFNKVGEDEYRSLYFGEILGKLDARQVVADLEELAGAAEPVLLCWEKPPLTSKNWCHRRMVAEWLKDKLGVDVPELVLPGGPPPKTGAATKTGAAPKGGAPPNAGPAPKAGAPGRVQLGFAFKR